MCKARLTSNTNGGTKEKLQYRVITIEKYNMQNITKPLFLGAFLASMLLVSIQTVSACSCGANGTVDQEFNKNPNIVVLKVRSVEKAIGEQPRLVNYGGIKQTTLTVEKVFKGKLNVGQELIFAQGGGADCVWTFTEASIGLEYLFYLGAKPLDDKVNDNVIAATGQFPRVVPKNVWIPSTCSRSGDVKYRANDLKYLENILKVRGKTRLSGVLTQYISVATADQESRNDLLAHYKVKITGSSKTIDLTSDSNGAYEIYDLPPGKYKLLPEKIGGYKFSGEKNGSAEVDIQAKKHTEQNFHFSINNAIRGRVHDANGKLLKDVCLDLLPARGKKAQYFYEADCTKEDGSFEFDEIPTGTYVIVVNDDDNISADEPFGTFYYPSAVKREDAVEVTVGPGDFLENLIINAPSTAQTITVKGTIRFENGRYNSEDAEFTSVEFFEKNDQGILAEDASADSRGTIDRNGNFSLRILKGQKGIVYAELMTFTGKYEKCPKLESIIRRSKKSMLVHVRTNVLKINAVNDIFGIELKFAFPLCKKRKFE